MMTRAAWALRQTWTLAAHDVGQWRRTPWAIAAALIPPAALALLLYILTFNLGHQPIALVQEGHGRYSDHIAGRLLGGVLVSLVVIVPTLAFATLTGAIAPPAGHWPALALVFLATALCAAGLGAVVGATMRGSRAVSMAAAVICTYLFFLGGGFTTVQFLPGWLRQVTTFVPIRYAIDGLRQSLFYPSLYGFGADMRVLLGTAIVAVVAGGVVVRRAWSR